MNERIRELAEQAGIAVWGDAVYMYDPKDTLDSTVMEKFAELIVEECRYVMDCNKGSDQNPAWNQALSETSEKIKEHFGVKCVYYVLLYKPRTFPNGGWSNFIATPHLGKARYYAKKLKRQHRQIDVRVRGKRKAYVLKGSWL